MPLPKNPTREYNKKWYFKIINGLVKEKLKAAEYIYYFYPIYKLYLNKKNYIIEKYKNY
jgi:hypothetical protein